MTLRSRMMGVACAAVFAVAAVMAAFPANAAPPAPSASLPPLGSPVHRPLAGTLVVTAGYGDDRGGHLHAGFDFGTGGHVGRAVRAPAAGWVERIRASGVGYGRSLYLRARDGRTFQLGHLDAYAARVDSFARRAQDSTGQYEQDLWPAAGAFAVKAGEVVAWSGESGAGGPHLHFEIRRGDVAYHPQRAGLSIPDDRAPTLTRLVLEPLDETSSVEGSPAPVVVPLTGADTVRATGRLRAVVTARDAVGRNATPGEPWSVGIAWRGAETVCRFDSLSWATDMRDAVYLHDQGRVEGRRGLVLWAPARYRPRAIRSEAPFDEEAGTVLVAPGDPARTLEVWARDAAGNETRRRVVLRGDADPWPAPRGPRRAAAVPADPSREFVSLPGGRLRWCVPASRAPGGVEFVVAGAARNGKRSGDSWSAIFSPPAAPMDSAVSMRFELRPRGSGGEPCAETVRLVRVRTNAAPILEEESGRAGAHFPTGAVFEDAVAFARPGPAVSSPDLVSIGESWIVEPATLPLRRSARVTMTLPEGESPDRVALYVGSGRRWSFMGGAYDAATRRIAADAGGLGAFALFRDDGAPRVAIRSPYAPATRGPYSRWAIEASVTEEGSGLDARASWLEVDGKRVPTEWDPEAGRLRWRPASRPAAGEHRVVAVAADRMGNVGRDERTFRVGR